ncbi:L-threonylcarbamoyladenylate synthase [Amaricoccus solimangrovi]|uniref:Threonylcarbamoyl-AMP synthase n=1 Tax=Amaricoccus solimangrovi TaxID=2589815 RepID=A0A501WU71_9RHOB|nr:L-threonylcarbamoyladenylate synthase [Amaricoccus solimangrovi]TPE52272.1 threonylcarbamoyl-AMP synthase [Amaricoccus solimangrovi]
MNTILLSDTPRGLRAAAGLLRQGGTVAFPTETVYGLGADARNDRAVARIYAAKGRPSFNPLIVHVRDLAHAEAITEMSPAARALGAAFWPGPLTLVLPRRAAADLSELTTAGLPSVAIRVPDHDLAQRLLAEFGGPLAAPSANPSGRVSATRPEHVMEGLEGRISAVFDAGPTPVGLESTILAFDGDTPVLLRPGGLPVEAIAAALGRPVDTRAARHITAPGQLSSHYAPRATLRLEAAGPGPDEVWLGFGPLSVLRPGLNLSPRGDLVEAAANLFSHLRAADALAAETGAARIAVAPVPRTGLGLAINDRLERAAAPRPGEFSATL